MERLNFDLQMHICSYLSPAECKSFSEAIGKRLAEYVNFRKYHNKVDPKYIQSASVKLPISESELTALEKMLRLSKLHMDCAVRAKISDVKDLFDVVGKLKLNSLTINVPDLTYLPDPSCKMIPDIENLIILAHDTDEKGIVNLSEHKNIRFLQFGASQLILPEYSGVQNLMILEDGSELLPPLCKSEYKKYVMPNLIELQYYSDVVVEAPELRKLKTLYLKSSYPKLNSLNMINFTSKTNDAWCAELTLIKQLKYLKTLKIEILDHESVRKFAKHNKLRDFIPESVTRLIIYHFHPDFQLTHLKNLRMLELIDISNDVKTGSKILPPNLKTLIMHHSISVEAVKLKVKFELPESLRTLEIEEHDNFAKSKVSERT